MKVLIFNFFDGIRHRGIPIYARGVAEAMRRVGIDTFEISCPRLLSRLPRPMLNILFVLFEQTVVPIARVWFRCGIAFYPYNSSGIIDILLNRALVAIHDLIPNERRSKGFSARYIKVTQAFHCRQGLPICAVSHNTAKCIRRLRRFAKCHVVLWPNPFYAFERAAIWQNDDSERVQVERTIRVLLCSGIGKNKDFRGALALLRDCPTLQGAKVRVVGMGNETRLGARVARRLLREDAERLTILGSLRLPDLVQEYRHANLIWVHSKKEGFGRCVIEGAICGRPIVASDIIAFRRLAWTGARLYKARTFDTTVVEALKERGYFQKLNPAEHFHSELESAVGAFFRRFEQG